MKAVKGFFVNMVKGFLNSTIDALVTQVVLASLALIACCWVVGALYIARATQEWWMLGFAPVLFYAGPAAVRLIGKEQLERIIR